MRETKRDICIIGAGIIGTTIARRLSRYRLKITLIEKADDVAMGLAVQQRLVRKNKTAFILRSCIVTLSGVEYSSFYRQIRCIHPENSGTE